MVTEEIFDDIKWFGHSTFSIKDEINKQRIYFIDPFDFKKDPKDKADIIFITHAHYDHWSPADIRKILTDETRIVAVSGCEGLNLPREKIIMTEPNKNFTMNGIKVQTVPAYNIKQERQNFHPKANNWVGYILTVNDAVVYHAGDTDFIPEMKSFPKINVAFLPIGGTFTMDVEEAVQAANVIKADVTCPIHYKRLLGEKSKQAEEKFKQGVKGKVEILSEI